MRTGLNAAALAAAALHVAPAAAQDAAAGKRQAVACQACHGMDGLSKMPDAPNLAGQPTLYLERQLRAFKTGERKHDSMTLIAKMLSEQEMRNLAAYYGSIAIEVRSPQ